MEYLNTSEYIDLRDYIYIYLYIYINIQRDT